MGARLLRILLWTLLALPALVGCAGRSAGRGPVRPGDSVAARAAGITEVRFRPVFELPGEDAARLVEAVPGGQWDRGLAEVAEVLLSLHVERSAYIDVATTSLVTARAGYPGQVHAMRGLTGGAFPEQLAAAIARATAGVPAVDLGLAVRRFDDGTALWVLTWSRHRALLDPLPRDIALDDPVPVRVDIEDPALKGAALRLMVAPPHGPVEELRLTEGLTRWLDMFHEPGRWRLEVVARQGEHTEVLLLFSVFVDAPPPEPRPLATRMPPVENPIAAEQALLAQLNALRADNGLAPVQWFSTFEPLVREHSAYMAAVGQARHVIDGLTPGVQVRARSFAFPFAFHHEAVAAALTATEAMQLVVDSPAHRRTLLCEPCTHVTIGAALEPVLDRQPRIFVTWELLEFPKGPPRRLDAAER
ncbi:MAG: CAP domain-containing protein [Deltaproteobacteria bacterium]|nr:MAG: CAP domain-containing protein [Deltaproteobacteria bacterium]